MIRMIGISILIWLLLITASVADTIQEQYVGCFLGHGTRTTDKKEIKLIDTESLTIELCINKCYNATIHRMTFATLENGASCACSNGYGSRIPDSHCDVNCVGSESQHCGGKGVELLPIYSVYTVCPIGYFGNDCSSVCHCNGQLQCDRGTGVCPFGCEVHWSGQNCNTRSVNLTQEYIGCYNDNLPLALEAKNPGGKTGSNRKNANSVDFCIEICSSFNYTYSGMQYGYDCGCGEQYSRYGTSINCNFQCPANRSQTCGGIYANSVYYTCPAGFYGLNCVNRCNCDRGVRCSNSVCPQSTPTCKSGWTGRACNVRDCAVNNGDCGVNLVCQDIYLANGSLSVCRCKEGYMDAGNKCIPVHDQYIGCFKESASQNSSAVLTTSNTITVEMCISWCQQMNGTYSMMKNGVTCACANEYGDSIPDENCRALCSGNEHQYCGGKAETIETSSAYSVYTVCLIGHFGFGCEEKCQCNKDSPCHRISGYCSLGCAKNWNGPSCNATKFLSPQYIGCYKDKSREEAFEKRNPDRTTGFRKWTNSIDYCLKICTKYKHTYMGLQYGCDCLCGESYDRHGPLPESNCTMACEANRTQICGGGWVNSVYSVCPFGTYGTNCTNQCICAEGQVCTLINGSCPRQCKPGWTGKQCNTQVINGRWCTENSECNAYESCQTIDLGFVTISRCMCPQGFTRRDPWSTCTDIDECQSGSASCDMLTENCTNTVGSYTCECRIGYERLEHNGLCSDVDECERNISSCEMKTENCLNTNGSYECICRIGFARTTFADKCVDVNECENITASCKSGVFNCSNTLGSFHCSYCQEGFFGVNGTCVPIVQAIDRHGDHPGGNFGALTGGVIGILVLLALIIVIVFLIIRKRSAEEKANSENEVIVKDSKHNKETELKDDQDFNLYINMNEVSSSVPVKELPALLKTQRSTPGALEQEFKSVPTADPTKTTHVGKKKELKTKNRFQNILPYDDNRVILVNLETEFSSDYINASFIKSYNKADKLIATQGPNDDTLKDFWRMIYENDVGCIVMITNLIEKGKKKCACYWPKSGDRMKIDDMTVSLKLTESWPNYVIRHLQLVKGSRTMHIKHWNFTVWPDHGVPSDIRAFLNFRRSIRQSMPMDKYTIVHCSAGVGRTGTFIAINYLLEQAEVEGIVDVPKCLRFLREQRPQMVQTLEQYEFIYVALATEFTIGKTVLFADEFEAAYRELMIRDKTSAKTRLETQFEMLEDQWPEKSIDVNPFRVLPKSVDISALKENTAAVFVQSWKRNDAYIVSDYPSKDSVDYFWNICYDYDCQFIVFIDNGQESDSFFPREPGLLCLNNWRIQHDLHSMEEYGTRVHMVLMKDSESEYSNTVVSTSRELTIFHVEPFINDVSLKYEVIYAMHDVIKKLTSLDDANASPIVIVTGPKSSLGGLVVATFSALDMLTETKEVDIFQICCDIKKSRSQLIPTLATYEELHSIVNNRINYTAVSSVYGNA